MRRSIVNLSIAGFVLMACAQSPASTSFPSADADAIRAARTAFETAVRDTAWAAWADIYSADAVLGPPNQPAVVGREALMRWARMLPPITSFTLTELDIDGRGDLAFVHGRYHMVVQPPGAPAAPDSGKYIEVWRKQANGSWKVSRDVFNSDVPLPVPPPAPAKR